MRVSYVGADITWSWFAEVRAVAVYLSTFRNGGARVRPMGGAYLPQANLVAGAVPAVLTLVQRTTLSSPGSPDVVSCRNIGDLHWSPVSS